MKKNKSSVLRDVIEVVAAVAVFGIMLWIFLSCVTTIVEYAGTDSMESGTGRATTCLRAQEAEKEHESAKEETEALKRYVEGEGQPPEWYRPDEEMAVEWTETERHDIGCPDYAYETLIYGWDGHVMEAWELDLFSKIFYLEFWGVSDPCAEAGCDAILNLWNMGIYGSRISDCLAGKNALGKWIYSVYPEVWKTKYDADGLAWCKELCLSRFENGPEWEAVYFQKFGYHDLSWSVPLYEMDGVYFSRGR